MHRSKLACTVVAGVAVLLVAAACGDDSAGSATTTPPPNAATTLPPQSTTTTAALVATTQTTAPGPTTVTLTAIDYGYADPPASVPAGTTLVLQNDSDVEVHEIVAVFLPNDETRTAAELFALPPDDFLSLPFNMRPSAVLIAPPGDSSFAVSGTGRLGSPGRYLIFCQIPIAVDPQVYLAAVESRAAPGPPVIEGANLPHFTAGMWTELVVEG